MLENLKGRWQWSQFARVKEDHARVPVTAGAGGSPQVEASLFREIVIGHIVWHYPLLDSNDIGIPHHYKTSLQIVFMKKRDADRPRKKVLE
jgi:hypothetical protein